MENATSELEAKPSDRGGGRERGRGREDGSWKAPFRFFRMHWDHEPASGPLSPSEGERARRPSGSRDASCVQQKICFERATLFSFSAGCLCTYLINGKRSAAFTPLQLSLAEHRQKINPARLS